MKFHFLFLCLIISTSCLSQDYSDNKNLSELSYMSLKDQVNCDSTSGSNLEHRICLNLAFQKADSTMNSLWIEYLGQTETDSLKNELILFQEKWVQNRRLQSEICSTGLRGHMLGVFYLSSMLNTTEARIQEIEELLVH